MTVFNYINGTPVAKFTIRGPEGEKEVTATVDSGASKSLIPTSMATDLGLKLKEVVDAIGVCPAPVKVNVYKKLPKKATGFSHVDELGPNTY